MLDLIRKGLIAGLGAAVVSKEKVEETVNKLVEEGRISRAEADKLVEELVEAGEKQWDDAQHEMRDSMKRGLESLDLCSHGEFLKLKAQVEAMEKRLSLMESALESRPALSRE